MIDASGENSKTLAALVNGIRIAGTGSSKDVEVWLGDSTVPVASSMMAVQSTEIILMVLPSDAVNGSTSVALRNPGGFAASATMQLANQ